MYSGEYMTNDVLCEYFEVVNEDVYYTFKGVICRNLNYGINSALYGKTINVSEMYKKAVDEITKMIIDGVFFTTNDYLDGRGYSIGLVSSVNKYTCKKYDITLELMDKIVNGRTGSFDIDRLYWCMIDRVGGLDRIDWLSIYKNSSNFVCNNTDILLYIAKEILKNEIYSYFVDRYKMRVAGIETCNNLNLIVLEWDGGKFSTPIGRLTRDKKDWWRRSTMMAEKNRGNIQDYDKLLNGRDESEVLYDVCPIDNSIVLNYTKIDFCVDKDDNITECKSHDGMDGKKTWSSASIDRIDSTKPYSYDNVEVISNYYNTQVKNCASIVQTGKLYYYRLHRLMGKNINKNGVKTMSDSELDRLFDDLSVYVNVIEIVQEYRKILYKEMDKRYKKSKLVTTKI